MQKSSSFSDAKCADTHESRVSNVREISVSRIRGLSCFLGFINVPQMAIELKFS
jgi:hypothetical protein